MCIENNQTTWRLISRHILEIFAKICRYKEKIKNDSTADDSEILIWENWNIYDGIVRDYFDNWIE